MAFKKRTVNYRKIYENHYGPIPVDGTGKSYDIHHMDGNHENNSPENLRAITVEEHYQIHYEQQDYYACYLIMTQRMSKTKEEISAIATLNNLQRVAKGTNPLVGGQLQKRTSKEYWAKMGDNHPGALAVRQRVKNGVWHLQKTGKYHPSYDSTIHTYHNVITKETVSMPQNDFITKYDLHAGAVSDLVNRKRNVWSVNDWVLVDPTTQKPIIYQNPNKDVRVYTFTHKKTHQTVSMTREEMFHHFSIKSNTISEMISGQRKSARGWVIVKNNVAENKD